MPFISTGVVQPLPPSFRGLQVQWYERMVTLQPQCKGMAEFERQLVLVCGLGNSGPATLEVTLRSTGLRAKRGDGRML
jgi:hypothetical protein